MASVDKGAVDGDGRPVNPPEPSDPGELNEPDAQDLKNRADEFARVVCYQFRVAVQQFYNPGTLERLERSFQENLARFSDAVGLHMARRYEDIIEIRIAECVEQRLHQAVEVRCQEREAFCRDEIARLLAEKAELQKRLDLASDALRHVINSMEGW